MGHYQEVGTRDGPATGGGDVSTETQEVDRSGWPAGPWDDEPDRVEFEHAGLPCLLNRGGGGAWCGYAAVPPGHPLHGQDYEVPDISVHGGLTYAGECHGAICHVPKPGEPDDVWWFGFDCAHAFDLTPSKLPYAPPIFDEVYRDVAYVRRETERLAEQLAAVKS
jgi:hypothetical protein